MCDPVTLGVAAALGAGGAIVKSNDANSAAKREADARNAVLQTTLGKEKGFAADNDKVFQGDVAHYAPGAQDTQLHGAQDARTATSVGNITSTDPNSIPITADAPPAVRGEIAKRMLAVHDGAVSRAGLTAKVGGYGDSWLENQLNTQDANRNIGVTNNYANGQKAILSSLQDAAAASTYKAPSLWGPALTAAGSIVGGAAGAGKSLSMPKFDVSNVWNPVANAAGGYQNA